MYVFTPSRCFLPWGEYAFPQSRNSYNNVQAYFLMPQILHSHSFLELHSRSSWVFRGSSHQKHKAGIEISSEYYSVTIANRTKNRVDLLLLRVDAYQCQDLLHRIAKGWCTLPVSQRNHTLYGRKLPYKTMPLLVLGQGKLKLTSALTEFGGGSVWMLISVYLAFFNLPYGKFSVCGRFFRKTRVQKNPALRAGDLYERWSEFQFTLLLLLYWFSQRQSDQTQWTNDIVPVVYQISQFDRKVFLNRKQSDGRVAVRADLFSFFLRKFGGGPKIPGFSGDHRL